MCPTISGKIVDARDQVLIMFLEPAVFMASMRLISLSSTNGPFFDDLLTSGGEGKSKGGRHPVTPWGVPTLGKRTRSKHKESDKLIVRGRRRGKEKR